MNPTIADVAQKAGVSITTVSRVINNNYPVSQKTRKKVEEAIKELDFIPNYMAQGLMKKPSHTIGVLIVSVTNPYFSEIVEGIDQYTKRHGYILFLCQSEDRVEVEQRYIKELIQRQVDGIIVVDGSKENSQNGFFEKISSKVPFVIINGYHEEVRCNFVISDQEKGVEEALRYLIELGHKDIAFIRGKEYHSYDIKEKVYKKILKESNLPYNSEFIWTVPIASSMNTILCTELLVEKYLLNRKKPTAIFACNDLMAKGVLNAAHKLNIKVPEQLSIIGHDNIYISEISEPPLTTIDLEMKQIGKVAGELLLDLINKDKEGIYKKVLIPHLIKRSSCTSLL